MRFMMPYLCNGLVYMTLNITRQLRGPEENKTFCTYFDTILLKIWQNNVICLRFFLHFTFYLHVDRNIYSRDRLILYSVANVIC